MIEVAIDTSDPARHDGEVWVDLLHTPGIERLLDLSHSELRATLDLPAGATGARSTPSGGTLFVKDGSDLWRAQYGEWQNADGPGKLTLALRPNRDGQGCSHTTAGFDPSRVRILGVHFGAGGEARGFRFRGQLRLNQLTIQPAVKLAPPPAGLPATSPRPAVTRPLLELRPDGLYLAGSRQFVLGANWRPVSYGQSIGTVPAWFPLGQGVSKRPNWVRSRLVLARRAGVQWLRVGLLDDGRTAFDEAGLPAPEAQQQALQRDLRMLLSLAAEEGVAVELVLADFHLGGRGEMVGSESQALVRGRPQVLCDAATRRQFVAHVLAPLLASPGVGDSPALVAVDLINEPEWLISRNDLWSRAGGWEDVADDDPAKAAAPLPASEVASYCSAAEAVVRQHAPGVLVTVGVSAVHTALGSRLCPTADYHAIHYYPWMTSNGGWDWARLPTDKPWLLEEYPAAGEPGPAGYLELAQRHGAAGALVWAFDWRNPDNATDEHMPVDRAAFEQLLLDLAHWRG